MGLQVAELGVPYIMMHMRGDPGTMQSSDNTAYQNVCIEVGRELQSTAAAAIAAGIEPWRIIPDPGEILTRIAFLPLHLPSKSSLLIAARSILCQDSGGTSLLCGKGYSTVDSQLPEHCFGKAAEA